jgi:ABC-2 type transport system ATP-binding protein
VLEIESLSRRYGEKVALDGLTFNVAPGEVVGFLGPNGAGKTTAMRAALGIVQPDSGSIRWDGKPVDLDARLRFGYIPEERGLYPTMSLDEQLSFLGQLHGMSKKHAGSAALHWLTALGLGDRMNDRLDSLSMGNQQRVQLAAALVHQPEVLVLDEPFSGLDPTGIEALSNVLKQRADDGVAVVFSSHQLDLVEGLCERVVIIDKGRDVLQGAVDELTVAGDVLRVRVHSADSSWTQGILGAEVIAVDGHDVTLRLIGATSDDVLDAARRAGTITYFGFERRRLSEVFREAVNR